MNRLVSEIRTSFSHDKDITFQNTSSLSYLAAVIEEALRVYPPFVTSLNRIVPEGGSIINGVFVPGKVCSLFFTLFRRLQIFLSSILTLLINARRLSLPVITTRPIDHRQTFPRRMHSFQNDGWIRILHLMLIEKIPYSLSVLDLGLVSAKGMIENLGRRRYFQ